jgi:hypothetical protein
MQAVPFESLVMDILRAQGPVAHTNVQPEFVRLHDDKVRCSIGLCCRLHDTQQLQQ